MISYFVWGASLSQYSVIFQGGTRRVAEVGLDEGIVRKSPGQEQCQRYRGYVRVSCPMEASLSSSYVGFRQREAWRGNINVVLSPSAKIRMTEKGGWV